MPRILVVDDDARARKTLIDLLAGENYSALPAEDGETAIKLIKEDNLNIVLLDLVLPDINGIEVLKQIKKTKPAIPVIIISGFGTIKDAVAATKEGAYDFLEKSNFDKNKFILLIKRAAEKERIEKQVTILREELLKKYQMVGISESMHRVFELIEDTAPKKVSILITGESGVGKELVARAIHNRSERRDKPFIKINCAAIPKELIESELFGFEKGAFTDAKEPKKGKLEIANEGTLFFDEIGDMGISAQAKLLRFLQEGEFEHLGSNRTIKVDVRIVAATNKNLEREISENNFREDLFYRLNVVHINIQPLRERLEDIAVLADYFLNTLCDEYGVPKKSLTADAIDFLKHQDWKGNIRELRNAIERSVILIRSIKINSSDLTKVMEIGDTKVKSDSKSLKDAREDFERDYIIKILNKYNWNFSQAAQILDIDRAHLYRKMKQLKITAPNY
jgi:two-component system, NtrC family, nitrogen regulation response regulator NtrX